MKRKLPILSIAALMAVMLIAFTSCQSKKAPDNLVLSATDTTGLAEFKSWKAMSETKEANEAYIQGYKDAIAEKTTVAKPAATKVVYRNAQPAVSRTVASQPAKKKGWSKAAKGTAIGATAGAVAGALINKKNRVVGGVIGGLLGGGIGYGVGRGMDKKDGRF